MGRSTSEYAAGKGSEESDPEESCAPEPPGAAKGGRAGRVDGEEEGATGGWEGGLGGARGRVGAGPDPLPLCLRAREEDEVEAALESETAAESPAGPIGRVGSSPS